jgi:Nucleotidyl transferase AbiEii toxin, Type IV TA system
MTRPTRADPGGRAYLDLQNRARREERPTQALLVLYVLERFLARLVVSPYADQFVLKGGMLLAAWDARRATVDGDFLARHMANDEAAVLERIVQVASGPAPMEDGVEFRLDTARSATIRESDLYTGVRVSMDAGVGGALVKLRLDVNVGDPVTPAPARLAYPTLRPGFPDLRVLGYPLATVLAEKLTTAVNLGAANTRVRDYADIWTLTGRHDLHADELVAALRATAAHRGVDLRPLSDVVADLAATRADTYEAYRRRLGPDGEILPADFATVVADVVAFADPVCAPAPITRQRWRGGPRRWSQLSP